MSAEAKFTPGVWAAKQRLSGYPDYAGGPTVFAWDVYSEDGTPIAIGTIAKENADNAHLIAAAPDLYAVLSSLMDAADSSSEIYFDGPTVDAMRAALDKAEGSK